MKDRDYHREYSRNYYHSRKSELVRLLGGACKKCGDDSNLQFDHIDPASKNFSISKLLNFSKEVVLKELEKCQLLCQSCHIEKTKLFKDGYRKRARGESVSSSVLTDSLVLKIRRLYQSGVSLNQLSMDFPDVKRSTLYAVVSNRTWKHVGF